MHAIRQEQRSRRKQKKKRKSVDETTLFEASDGRNRLTSESGTMVKVKTCNLILFNVITRVSAESDHFAAEQVWTRVWK